jgi:hypothetical protein
MRISRKAVRWAWIFGGPALLLLVYVPFATRGTGRSDFEELTVFALLTLPGAYAVGTLPRPWWARVIFATGYICFVFILFLVYALSYSCSARAGGCL